MAKGYTGAPYKLTIAEKEVVRGRLLHRQNYVCPLCGASLRGKTRGGAVLDHCHEHKHVRAVLCKVCNTGEGVVKQACIRYGGGTANHVQWLRNLAKYLELHQEPQTKYIYPETKKKRVIRRKKKVVQA